MRTSVWFEDNRLSVELRPDGKVEITINHQKIVVTKEVMYMLFGLLRNFSYDLQQLDQMRETSLTNQETLV